MRRLLLAVTGFAIGVAIALVLSAREQLAEDAATAAGSGPRPGGSSEGAR